MFFRSIVDGLNIMFSYYGAKTKFIYKYPAPLHDKIIEPFAGSARYSLQYFDHDVLLCDTSEYVVKVWEYLINASTKDILSLPYNILSKVNINEYSETKNLTDAEKYLIGFGLCPAKSKPRTTGHGRMSWDRDRLRISKLVDRVKHWKVIQQSFELIPNEKATYFVDPPYKEIQKTTTDKYYHFQVDYDKLAEFVLSRQGQVIACEGKGVDYLPFEYLALTGCTSNKFNYEFMYHQVK